MIITKRVLLTFCLNNCVLLSAFSTLICSGLQHHQISQKYVNLMATMKAVTKHKQLNEPINESLKEFWASRGLGPRFARPRSIGFPECFLDFVLQWLAAPQNCINILPKGAPGSENISNSAQKCSQRVPTVLQNSSQ